MFELAQVRTWRRCRMAIFLRGGIQAQIGPCRRLDSEAGSVVANDPLYGFKERTPRKRFLEHRFLLVRSGNVGRVASGREDVGEAPRIHDLRDGVNHLAGDIEVQDRGVHDLLVEKLQGLLDAAGRAHDLAFRFDKHVFQLEGDRGLILDHEDLESFEGRALFRFHRAALVSSRRRFRGAPGHCVQRGRRRPAERPVLAHEARPREAKIPDETGVTD